jgi:hypothetical protein
MEEMDNSARPGSPSELHQIFGGWGVGLRVVSALGRAGISTRRQLSQTTHNELREVPGIGPRLYDYLLSCIDEDDRQARYAKARADKADSSDAAH